MKYKEPIVAKYSAVVKNHLEEPVELLESANFTTMWLQDSCNEFLKNLM